MDAVSAPHGPGMPQSPPSGVARGQGWHPTGAPTGMPVGAPRPPVQQLEFQLAKLHQHARGLVLPCLVLIASGAFIGYAMRGLREGGSWIAWAIVVGIAAVVLGLLPILAWLRNRVVITNIATTRFTGLFNSRRQVMAHFDVVEVQMRRNGWQALFGSGNVWLIARDGRRVELRDVPNVVTVAGALRELAGLPVS